MNGDKSRKGKGKKKEEEKQPPPPESDEKPKLARSISIKSFIPRGKSARKSVTVVPSKSQGKEGEAALDFEDPYAHLSDSQIEAAELIKSPDAILDISDKKSTVFPDHTFAFGDRLQMINAAHNLFTKLPNQICDFTALKVLVVNDNKLTELPKNIGNLVNLKVVDLQNNLLTGLPRSTKSWTNVTKLYLSGNRIASFPIEITKMTSLQRLTMDHNQLYTVPDKISALTDLDTIELTHNYIKPLPPSFWKLNKVKQMRLGYNQIDKIPDNLSGLTDLTVLDLSYNHFTVMPAKSLATIPKLEELDFGGNNLTSIPPDINRLGPTLKRLSLAKNELVDLPEEFSALKKLEALDLRGCPLAGLKFGLGRWKAILVELTGLSNLQTGNLPQKKIQMLNASGAPAAAPTNATAARTIVAGQKPGQPSLPPKPDASEFGLTSGKAGAGGGAAAFAGGKTMPAMRGGGRRGGRPPVDITSMFEAPASPSGNGAAKPSGGSDVGGGNLFDMWKSQSSQSIPLDAEGESEEGGGSQVGVEGEDQDDGNEAVYERKPGEIVHDFGCAEDMNKLGIQRAKKEVIQQEDTHIEHYPFADHPNVGLFCVFDGHGGKECSTAATKLVPNELSKWLKHHELKKDAANLLHVTFMTVDEIMREFEYEGCTATVVLVWSYKDKTYVQAANVGDSFAFLSNGVKVIELSQEHKLSKKHEQIRFDNLGIAINDGQTRIAGGIAITRALGDHFSKDNNSGMIAAPFISPPIKLSGKPTHLVLASDGLWDVMSGAQALRMAKKGKTALESAQRIMRTALKNKECKDNITVTVLRL